MLRGSLPAMWNLQIGLPLPVFAGRKQAPLVEAATEDIKVASARADSLRQQQIALVRTALTMYQAELKQEKLYQQALIPQARLTVDALMIAYVSGQSDFFDLREAYGRYLEYHLTLPEKKRNAQQALAMIEEILATSLSYPYLDQEIEL